MEAAQTWLLAVYLAAAFISLAIARAMGELAKSEGAQRFSDLELVGTWLVALVATCSCAGTLALAVQLIVNSAR